MKTLDDLLAEGVHDRYVLVRADLNVPLDGDRITDDGRIRAALPTLTRLAGAGAKVLVTAHLGRPQGLQPDVPGGAGSAGGLDPQHSLAPVAERLGELLDQRVSLAADVVGESAHGVAAGLGTGSVSMLANVRYDARETGTPAEREQLAT